MNRFLKSWQLIALSVLVLLGTSCDKDDANLVPASGGNILIGSRVANPDGMTGTAYIQLIENLDKATYTNEQAFEASYSIDPIIRENEVYDLPGWGGTSNLLKIYTKEGGELVSKGQIELPAKSGANAMEIVGDKIYVSYNHMGKIAVIDKNSLEVTKEIDITSYGVGDENPDPCQMVERDGILYIGLNQLVGGKPFPNPMRPMVDVLLIDIKTDKPIKMITEETSGMSMPTKPEADDYSMFKDENDDIYINCISGFGFIKHEAGFLRIKKGETDFDKSYQFKITQTTIEGEENKASYVMRMKYAGNGIVYATVDIPAYYSSPKPNFVTDRSVAPVKIDLKAQTIKCLSSARSNNPSTSVAIHGDKVLFGLSTTTDNGFYIYDSKTNKMSDGAVITTTGFPMCCLKLSK